MRDHPQVRLVKLEHVLQPLDHVALRIGAIVGSMVTFLATVAIIAAWMLLGRRIGDPPPWLLLLTIMNLPQLPIMISLQVSANLAQRHQDARAEADHAALTHIATAVDRIEARGR